MKLRENERRSFLAALPLIAVSGNLKEFWPLVAVASAALFFSGIFFRLTAPLFPPRLFRASILLFGAALSHSLYLVCGLSPLWAASFFLLLDFNDFTARRHGLGRLAGAFSRTALFTFIVLGLGLIKAGAERMPWLLFWSGPAGFLLLLALLAALIGWGRSLPRRRAGKKDTTELVQQEPVIL